MAPQAAILASNRADALVAESTLHQLSPYIGKLKSSIARARSYLQFTEPGNLFYRSVFGIRAQWR